MKMIRLFFVLTLICGVLYPLLVTGISMAFFSEKAGGSLIHKDDQIVGSSLLAQKFMRDDFFHSRPSAADYATLASGASQSSVTQKLGRELREKRQGLLPEAGADAWTASGSGLDPHITPQTAYAQVPRVSAARSIPAEKLKALIESFIEGPTLGIWGQARVNVLELNLALLKGNNGDTRSDTGNP